MVLFGIRVGVTGQIRVFVAAFHFFDDPSGDQLHIGGGAGKVQVFTAVEQRRTGRADVHLPCAAAVEEFRGFPELCAAHNGIVDQKQAFVPDQIVDGNQLHLGNQVALALHGRHERAGPGWRVFDKRSGVGNAGGIGITDGMRRTGIRHAGHNIGPDAACVPSGESGAAVIAHLFHADTLVGGGRIAVVNPEEGTDPHFFAGSRQCLNAVGRHDHDFPRAQIPQGGVAQIQIGKALKGQTIGVFLSAQRNGGPSHFVPGRQDALGGHDHNGHGSVDDLLGKLDSFNEIIFLVDDSRHQFRGIDIAAAHFQKMGGGGGEEFLYDFIGIVDLSDGHDGKGAMVGADDQRLGFVVRNTADAQMAAHALHFFVKFCPKGRIFNVVDGTVEAFPVVIDRHTGASGAKMGVIVCPEIEVKYAIFL